MNKEAIETIINSAVNTTFNIWMFMISFSIFLLFICLILILLIIYFHNKYGTIYSIISKTSFKVLDDEHTNAVLNENSMPKS